MRARPVLGPLNTQLSSEHTMREKGTRRSVVEEEIASCVCMLQHGLRASSAVVD